MALTDMVIMPGADYQDACDAVREKTGGTDKIKSGNLGAQIRAITGGEDLDAELATQDTLLTEQKAKIAELAEILSSKAAASSDAGEWTAVSAGDTLALSPDGPVGYVYYQYDEGNNEIVCEVCMLKYYSDGTPESLDMSSGWGDYVSTEVSDSGVTFTIDEAGYILPITNTP